MRKLSLLFLPLVIIVASCNQNATQPAKKKLSFAKTEYSIHSGESITVEQNYPGIKYSFVGSIPNNTTVNENSGQIIFTNETPNYSQVLLVASYESIKSSPAVVTLLQNNVTTTLSFHTPIKNIIDGDYILVTSSNNTAITYALKTPVTGVSIDSMTGRVSYTSAAIEGSKFIVVASSADAKIEEEYTVVVSHMAVSINKSQSIEIGSNIPATYVLDFSDTPSGTEEDVIAVLNDNKAAEDSEFSYNKSTHTLVLNKSFLDTFETGENKVKIITPRNIITADLVMVTKFIKNAHELQAINKDRASLAGYYILENDIDLTDYLALGGEGYNDNRGWNQIGIYHDLEADPTRDSFTGTFDGNGHVISGYFEKRADDLAHNEGLFGYVTNQAIIKNVGFVGAGKTEGRNFIGGFVGFNEGVIKNCWSDVQITNKHEDRIFHSVGAFAGANTGVIDSCYTLGEATGDTFVGAFVGKNYGDITNCYSYNATNGDFVGTQITGTHDGCLVFDSLGTMKSFDFASHFDNSAWDFPANNLPVLKNNVDIDVVNGIEIANKEKDLFKGDVLEVNAIIHPNALHDTYINDVVYTLVNPTGSGIIQNGNKFDTSAATVNEFTVTASIDTVYGEFATSMTFTVNEKIESFDIVDDFPIYVEPGKQYQLNYNITPSTANSKITWEFVNELDERGHLTRPDRFAFFTGNILTIKEEMMNFQSKLDHPTFKIKGTTFNGLSQEKELTLTRIHYLGNKYCFTEEEETITQGVVTLYKDSTDEYINFTLPNNAEMVNIQVSRFSTNIPSSGTNSFKKSGHTVRIPVKYITEIPNRQVSFTFRCGSGASQIIYRGYACYIDHNRYTQASIPTQYVTLSSAQDFYDNFRMTKEDTDASKWANYSKTYVLTNDIDFNNAADLVAIGYKADKYEGTVPFSGTIYGCGHTIKNAKFHYTERYKFEGPTDPSKRADANTYYVGFFGYFSGRIYDVVFENITSNAYNYGGCFAGSILAGGYLEDIKFIDCKALSANEVDYTIDDVIEGRVAAVSAGTFVGVTYNGTAVGLIGKQL